jgi:hypothetical protein
VSGDDNRSQEPPPSDAKNRNAQNLNPDQLRALLRSDFSQPSSSARAGSNAFQRAFAQRKLLWAGLIVGVGLLYAVFRVTTSPAKVIVMNISGEAAASVVLISGEQRVDLGEVGNGAVEQVELLAGHPLQIEYSFGTRRVWVDNRTLTPLQVVTVTLTMDRKVRVVRGAPSSEPPP